MGLFRTTACMVLVVAVVTSPALAAKKGSRVYQFGPTGFLGNLQKNTIKVTKVDRGSPADGKIKPGMVIIGAGTSNFQEHVRRELAEAIDAAETEEAGGKLTLILQGGQKIDITLKVLGSYSDTAPYNCPKCEAILKRARIGGTSKARIFEADLARMASRDAPESSDKPEGGNGPEAGDTGRGPVETRKNSLYCTWRWGYELIAKSEGYLRTRDSAKLPEIRKLAVTLAKGQDAGGLYGHQLALPERNGRLPGYAQMNQPSLSIFIGLLLAQKCGVKDAALTEAIERTHAFYASFIGRGTLNYGVHGPNTRTFNNNGMSATAAIAMALKGNKEGAAFFSQLAAASYDGLETGHASHFFNVFWTPLGVAVAGPEVTSAFFKKARWLYTMYRRWDGSFTFDGSNKGFNGSALVLPYTLGKRSLLITGRNADESIWLKGKAATDVVEMGSIDYQSKSTDELVALTEHPFPQVRRNAGWILQHREDYKPDIEKLLKEGSKYEKMQALGYSGWPKPKETGLPYLDKIGAVLRDAEEDAWVRARAASALAYMGQPAHKYYMDMARFIAEERPWDRFGDVEWSVGKSITELCKEPFTAGLVTDKDLLYKASRKMLHNKRQHVRTYGQRMLADMPKEDFYKVADTVMYVVKDDDPTYHSYHSPGGYVGDGIAVLARMNVKEGIPCALDLLEAESGKWSFKCRTVFAALAKYGAAAKPALEKLKADPRFKNVDKGKLRGNWHAMVKAIEGGKDPGKLISFEEAVKACAAGKEAE